MTSNLNYNSTHKWDKTILDQYGNDRCSECGMQYRYYVEGIATLKTWSKKDIEGDKEHFEKVVKRFQVCEPK